MHAMHGLRAPVEPEALSYVAQVRRGEQPSLVAGCAQHALHHGAGGSLCMSDSESCAISAGASGSMAIPCPWCQQRGPR